MDQMAFGERLIADGFEPGELKKLEPGMVVGEHRHPFEVRALVLSGEIALTVAGTATTYRAGDIFTMAADCAHAERIGAEGVAYLVGRRRASAAHVA